MLENFKISLKEIDKINLINQEDKNYRIKNLEFFNQKGFPTKKEEDWKFSDLREIFSKNFKKLKFITLNQKKINLGLLMNLNIIIFYL